MKKEKKGIEEKEKRCPFSKDLKCGDCRLYQPFLGGEGKRVCVFLRMNE